MPTDIGRYCALFAAALVVFAVGCGEEESESSADDEVALQASPAVCFGVEHPTEPGGHGAGEDVTIYAYIHGEDVPECTGEISGDCQALGENGELVVEHDLQAVVDEDDCPGESGFSVDCGDVELEEQLYDVDVGDQTYEHQVPPADAGDSGPLGPEYSDCVGVGEQRSDDEIEQVCAAGDEATVSITVAHEVGAASCVDDFTIDCEATEEDGEITVTSSASYRWVGGDNGDCTADLWTVDAECGQLELSEGSYDVVAGDVSMELEIPANGEVCSTDTDG